MTAPGDKLSRIHKSTISRSGRCGLPEIGNRVSQLNVNCPERAQEASVGADTSDYNSSAKSTDLADCKAPPNGHANSDAQSGFKRKQGNDQKSWPPQKHAEAVYKLWKASKAVTTLPAQISACSRKFTFAPSQSAKHSQIDPTFFSSISEGREVSVTSELLETEKSDTPRFTKGIHLELPPLSKIEDIFDDLTDKALPYLLTTIVPHLGNQKLRVATMCSGTESPLLALSMVRESLAKRGHHFDFRHLFSAEIVPRKQAYIERNFRPPVIFRDITELAKNKTKRFSTAYGGMKSLPSRGSVELLVAGFSCVDFSTMNNNRKQLDGRTVEKNAEDMAKKEEAVPKRAGSLWGFDLADSGESGDTLYSIFDYAKTSRPRMVLLENVLGAPYEEICAEFQTIGYVAGYMKVDTKDYYIPHTRRRGYILCLDIASFPGNGAWAAIKEWTKMMEYFKRPASSPVDAFLLDDYDPRLTKATRDLVRVYDTEQERTKKVMDWLRCQIRHLQYREDERLGTARPITQWMANGPSRMLDFANIEWTKHQVDRIKDVIDMIHLRGALYGFDPSFKPTYPDLSQNIDRNPFTRGWGLTGCQTPSGMPYSTTRGGPIVGLEALALQGIPIDKLNLTNESLAELQDLAGNAMTTTVVGAALISALIVGHKAFPTYKEEKEAVVEMDMPRRSATDAYLDVLGCMVFGPVRPVDVSEICRAAIRSARLCTCEDQLQNTPAKILRCRDCSHTACQRCAGIHKHNYEDFAFECAEERLEPAKFRKLATEALPMKIHLANGIEVSSAECDRDWDGTAVEWGEYFSTAKRALNDQYYYQSSIRSAFWTITYEGTHSKLELKLSTSQPLWLLYAKPRPILAGNAKARQLLEEPVARMTVTGQDLLQGFWQFCVPITLNSNILIRGTGDPVPSWRAQWSLPDFKDEKMWPELMIDTVDHGAIQNSKVHVRGLYTYLPLCGTANRCLYKKPSETKPLYLFLDPERVGEPEDDNFVISSDHRRLTYKERRHIKVKLGDTVTPHAVSDIKPVTEIKWRPTPETMFESEWVVNCTSYGRWIPYVATLQVFTDSNASYESISEDINLSFIDSPQCQTSAFTVLTCRASLDGTDRTIWPRDTALIVSHSNEREVFTKLSWLMERNRELGTFSDQWRNFGVITIPASCPACSPMLPRIRWKRQKQGTTVVPYEEVTDAIEYERATKARPSPITIHAQDIGDNIGCLTIDLNVATLIHQAMSRFCNKKSTEGEVRLEWRLNTAYQPTERLLPKFDLQSNQLDAVLPYTFSGLEHNKETNKWQNLQLRQEQQRSLQWMTERENGNGKLFLERSIAEAMMPHLGWCVQGRATRSYYIRGGVIADKVGYGKTITMLALIQSRREATRTALQPDVKGHISLRATLIVTPGLLVTQWRSETEQFLGKDCVVLVLKTSNDLTSKSVSDFERADIILVSRTLLTNEKTLKRLSRFAALPEPLPATEERAFTTWLMDAQTRVSDHIADLQKWGVSEEYSKLLNKRLVRAENDPLLHERIPSRRLRGEAYIDRKKYLAREPVTSEVVEAKTDDLFDLAKKDLSMIRGPVLQMFKFPRVVIDEYTYFTPNEKAVIASLQADSRWALSGTPELENYTDVRNLAAWIGVDLGTEDFVGQRRGRGNSSESNVKTDAETFRAYCEFRSPHWHREHHEAAQSFLDVFARQNVAEITTINLKRTYEVVDLSSIERATYLELQTQLFSQEMQLRLGIGPTLEDDHVNGLNQALLTSRSPQEALLKTCSQFKVSSTNILATKFNPTVITVVHCVDEVQKQRQLICSTLAIAFSMMRYCGGHEEHFTRWVALIKAKCFRDAEVHEAIIAMMRDIEKNGKVYEKKQSQTEKDVLKELRELKDELHKMCAEFLNKTRTHRFYRNLHIIQQWATSYSLPSTPISADCKHTVSLVADLHILVQCGHTKCAACISLSTEDFTCGIDACDSAAFHYHHVPATRLALDRATVIGPKYYGAKIEQIIEVVKRIRLKKEQALIFVQYSEVMDTVAEAFKYSRIGFSKVTGNTSAQAREDEIFQRFKDGLADKDTGIVPTVLMLPAGSSCAAGHNITVANHVLFVSPLFTPSRYAYEQGYEQAIGRSRRFKQDKPVYTYEFLALETIDVNTIEDRDRHGRKVVWLEHQAHTLMLKKTDQDMTEYERRQNHRAVDLLTFNEMTESLELEDGTTRGYQIE